MTVGEASTISAGGKEIEGMREMVIESCERIRERVLQRVMLVSSTPSSSTQPSLLPSLFSDSGIFRKKEQQNIAIIMYSSLTLK